MKLFTGTSGKFQMFIPIEWEYKNPSMLSNDSSPESFGEYSKMKGAFQISCKPINSHIEGLISSNNIRKQKANSYPIDFLEKFNKIDDKRIYTWMAGVGDHFFLATYIYGRRKYRKELRKVRQALNSIKFIKPQYRAHVVALDRYNLFMSAMAATIDLKNKALKNASFIEYVVLTANHIDALLRLSIILTTQLENKTSNIDTKFLFQSPKDKPKMEKEIYRVALDKKIISQELFNELNQIYNDRNKVVHRYIITDIRTEDLFKIGLRYFEVEEKVNLIIENLENEQYTKKIGINSSDVPPGESLKGEELIKLKYRVRDKHGRINFPDEFNKLKRIGKIIVQKKDDKKLTI